MCCWLRSLLWWSCEIIIMIVIILLSSCRLSTIISHRQRISLSLPAHTIERTRLNSHRSWDATNSARVSNTEMKEFPSCISVTPRFKVVTGCEGDSAINNIGIWLIAEYKCMTEAADLLRKQGLQGAKYKDKPTTVRFLLHRPNDRMGMSMCRFM